MKLTVLFLMLILSLGYFLPVDAQEPTLTEVARLGRGTAQSLSWRPDGEILAVGSTSGVWLFDADGEQIAHHPAFPVKNVEFSPDGEALVLSDVRGMSEIWQLAEDGAIVSRSEPLALGGYNVRWSPDSRRISSLYQVWENQRFDRMMLGMWDATSETLVWELSPSDTVLDVIWSPDGQRLAVTDLLETTVVLIDAESGETLQTFDVLENLPTNGALAARGAIFTEDGAGLWMLFRAGANLWILDFETGDMVETDIELPDAGYDLLGLERQPGGHRFATQLMRSSKVQSLYVLDDSAEAVSIGVGDVMVDYAWVPGEDRISALTRSGILSERGLSDDDVSIDRQLFEPPSES